MTPIKTGWATTEFVMALATLLYVVLKQVGVFQPGNETAEVGVIATIIAYILSRTWLKTTALKTGKDQSNA